MKLKLAIYASLLSGIALFSSCKKTDNLVNGSKVEKGQSSMSFTTSSDFAGTKSVSISGGVLTSAIRQASTGYEQITLTGSALNGTTSRTYQFILEVPTGASTTSGNLTADFSNPDNATIIPILAISATTGGTSSQAFGSDAGTVTITKLTAEEIEGTFSCGMKNESAGTTINLTNGKFYGKFK
jgi:hypothetical protein